MKIKLKFGFFVTAISLLIFGCSVVEQEIFTNAFEPEPIGFINGLEQIKGPWKFQLRDNYAFLADGRNGFVVADISDPESISTVSRLDSSTYTCPKGECFLITNNVVLDQNYAYLQESADRLIIANITDPTDVSLVTKFSIGDFPNINWEDIALSGNHLFVSTKKSGLRVIDVTNKTDPTEVGNYQPSDNELEMSKLAIHGQYAYVAVKNKDSIPVEYEAEVIENGVTKREAGVYYEDLYGLMIFDISAPSTPQLIQVLEMGERVENLVLDGHYAYLLLEKSLQIFDISDPETPKEVGSYQTEAWTWEIAKHENRIYIANVNRIYVIDVSDPSNPSKIGFLKTSAIGGSSSFDLAVADNYLYFSGTFNPTSRSDVIYGLTVIDLNLFPMVENQN